MFRLRLKITESQYYQHIYLSPHFDDAVLSCRGTILVQRQAGESVSVVTVCEGTPDCNCLSAYAATHHACYTQGADPVATRLTEDGAAMDILGADHLYFGYLHCISRRDSERFLYTSLQALFGNVDPADTWLINQYIAEVAMLRGKIPYGLLAVDHHVDHQMVWDSALHSLRRGQHVLFHEDFAYVESREDMEPALVEFSPVAWQTQIVPIDV